MRVSIKKELLTLVLGASAILAIGAGISKISLMINESTGECSQSVNFTGTTTLNSAAIATQAYSDGLVTAHNSDGSAHSSAFAAKLTASNNLSDVSSASTARTNLGLGTAATQAVGTSAGNVVQLDGSAKLPAVDGSALTNLPASGESNTASNLGTGTGVFAQKSSVDLQFKSLVAGTNIEITNDSTGITIAATGSASGEANTASNIGVGGVGVFAQKSGVDLQFKNIIAGSNKVLVSDDTADSEIAVDVQPGNIAHQDLSGAGTNTHSQIDSHISSTSNPHSVTAAQVGAISTAGAAEINALTEKTTPADNDEIVIEDSEASYAKKKVKISNLPAGGSGSTSDTSWTGSNWTSTTSSPSQRAIEEVVKDTGVRYDDRASAGTSSTNGKFIKQYVGGDTNTALLLHCDGTDASNTFTDSSVYAKTVTANGNAQIDTAQYKFGTASGLFDGTGDYLSVASSDFDFAADDFTVDFWFRAAALNSGNHYLFGGHASHTYSSLVILQSSSNLILYSSANGTSWDVANAVSISSSLSTDTWYHVEIARDGTNLRYFLNGNLIGTVTTSATLYNATSNLLIGASYLGENFNGWIDEIRVSKSIARHTASFTPETSAYTLATIKDFRLSSVKDSDIIKSNLLINGDFRINQRGYSSGTATTAANQFTFDRWFIPTSGQNLTFSSNKNGNIVTAPASGIVQVVEGVNIEGGTYVLSWTGTATATVNGTSVANGGTVTLTANTNVSVKFLSGTVYGAKLELGSTATSYVSSSYQEEILRCYRYYFVSSSGSYFFMLSGNSAMCRGNAVFPVPMRTAPTVVILTCYCSNTNSNVDNVSAINIYNTGFHSIYLASNFTPEYSYLVTYTAAAELTE